MKQSKPIQFTSEVSEVQLIYKSKINAADRPQIGSYLDAVAIFRHYWNANTIELQEEIKVLYLNQAHRVLGIYPLSTGTITGTLADCRLILLAGIRLSATALMLCHNHPSGSTAPSKQDKRLTEQIKAAASLLDMRVVDHIILTKSAYFSFSMEGLL